MVKMDFRLVPHQTPEKMLELLRAHLDRRGYDDIEIVELGGLYPARTPVDHPLVESSEQVWRDMGETQVVITPSAGGSGPMSLIAGELGIPTVMTGGVASAESRVHSPNESIALADFKEGVRYWGRFFARMSGQ
jgi:acetylornithine deacetylase/succinyl-diaminopimelate desuccinylase-like protein